MSEGAKNSIIVATYPERGAGNNPELWGVAFHHLGPTSINAKIVKRLQIWLIETEGKVGVMICLSQGGRVGG